MLIYIAGKLRKESDREKLEKIASICEKLGFETFLPHRDVGLAESIEDVDRIFEGDVNRSLSKSDCVVALLDGLHVGAGTAWELGYAYAKGITSVGIKTDESVKDGLEYLSAIIVGSMPIVNSVDELENFLISLKK